MSVVSDIGTFPSSLFKSIFVNGAFLSSVSKEADPPVTNQDSPIF